MNVLAKIEGKLIATWQGEHHGKSAGMIASVWVVLGFVLFFLVGFFSLR